MIKKEERKNLVQFKCTTEEQNDIYTICTKKTNTHATFALLKSDNGILEISIMQNISDEELYDVIDSLFLIWGNYFSLKKLIVHCSAKIISVPNIENWKEHINYINTSFKIINCSHMKFTPNNCFKD